MGVALEYAMRRPDVLVVVTSTYEAGGLLAATADIEYLKKINKSVEQMNRELAWDLSNLWDLLSFHAGFQELTIEEAQLLSTIESSNALTYFPPCLTTGRAFCGPARSTGSSVPVFAAGPAAEIIVQQQDQAGLGKALKQVIQ